MWVVWLSCWIGIAGGQPGDILVVASDKTPIENLTVQQLKQIYLGKIDLLDGVRITPVQPKESSALRRRFDRAVLGENFNARAYWLAEKVKVGARTPMTLSGDALILAIVGRNPGFIGYVDASHLPHLKQFGLKLIRIIPRDP